MNVNHKSNYYILTGAPGTGKSSVLNGLKDRMSRARIRARIDKVALGNFGDYKSVGDGVNELRFTFGPGYRVYYGLDGEKIILLLFGGEKSTQEKDIKKAKEYWKDYKERSHE